MAARVTWRFACYYYPDNCIIDETAFAFVEILLDGAIYTLTQKPNTGTLACNTVPNFHSTFTDRLVSTGEGSRDAVWRDVTMEEPRDAA